MKIILHNIIIYYDVLQARRRRCVWIPSCPAVSTNCRVQEVIVFQMGRQRCEGCPFCLDGPFGAASLLRRKRAIPDNRPKVGLCYN